MTVDISWRADCGRDLVCRRCLIPGRGWHWDDDAFCEPCHRAIRGDDAVDRLVLSDHASFGEWWTEELFNVTGRYPVAEVVT